MLKEELLQQKAAIDAQLKEIEAVEKAERYAKNAEFLKVLRDNKDLILSLIGHDRTSCSDSNPINGFDSRSSGDYRCTKCALIEVFEESWDDSYMVSFEVIVDRI